jgi:prevent-host-death family protein
MQVNILEAKNRLSQLIKSAQAGEDVVIANRGEPVARLVPMGKPTENKDTVGSGPAIVAWLKAHPLPAHARRSAEEIDADVQAERDSWD